MFQLIKCRVLQLVRDKGDMFWALAFPLLLATLMYMAFGETFSGSEIIDIIPVAIVVEEENTLSDSFKSFAEEMDDVLEVSYMDEEEALKALEQKDVKGIFYTGGKHSLTVTESDLDTSILQSLLDSYVKNEAMILEIAQNHPENLEKALASLNNYQSSTQEVTVSGRTYDTSLSYFFAVIAMASLYGCFLGIRCPIDMQANLSALGARRSVTPTHRLKLVIADMLATFAVHFANVMILLLYMKYVLRLDFGDRMGGMILVCLVGSMIGVALGMFVGSIGRITEGIKIGLILAVSMVCSFLSGLMVTNMKDIIEQKAPIINRINPAALISDAFYCLNVYDDMGRYFRNLILLVIISILLIGGSFLMVRRERYDSI